MRRPQPLQPEPTTDFDRIGWTICKFANGGDCECGRRFARCCESVGRTVEHVLSIVSAGRTAIENRDAADA